MFGFLFNLEWLHTATLGKTKAVFESVQSIPMQPKGHPLGERIDVGFLWCASLWRYNEGAKILYTTIEKGNMQLCKKEPQTQNFATLFAWSPSTHFKLRQETRELLKEGYTSGIPSATTRLLVPFTIDSDLRAAYASMVAIAKKTLNRWISIWDTNKSRYLRKKESRRKNRGNSEKWKSTRSWSSSVASARWT